jgi:precorrin-8X/cobalt-precorrin-8 methylmutase
MSERVGPYLREPQSIYAESREVIRTAVGTHHFGADEFEIVLRMIQASADLDFAATTVFTLDALTAGLRALRGGADLVLDVEMVKVGVEHDKFERWGGQIRCCIQDPDVKERAAALGTTRASVGIEKAADRAEGCVVAIGNAPTALFTVVELIASGRLRPALVIGMPVGFVLATESKDALLQLSVPSIVCRGRKGGSAVTVAAVNGLLDLASGGVS